MAKRGARGAVKTGPKRGKSPARTGNWPADHVERRGIDGLIPSARNPRTHSEAQIAQIAASMREWGWTNPVLVDENGTIIAGHGRVQAARQLGIGDVPVMVAEGWTEAQKRAYCIADNKLAENAGLDREALSAELAALVEAAFHLPIVGFDEDELARLLHTTGQGLTDPDVAPTLPDVASSRPGDLWLLGKHRVLCGDATDAGAVTRLLGDVRPHLMITDPPYGVDYDPDWRNRADRANGTPIGACAVGTVANDTCVDWTEAWALFPGDVSYCWHAGLHTSAVQTSLEAAGFEIRCQIIWAKDRFVISRGHYHWQHEPCWYAVRKNAGGGIWVGDRKQSTLWEIAHHKSETGHSTQKPIECMRRPMENNSSPGHAVYDPFLGSGTTVIAAEMGARQCLGLELNAAYVDVIVKRWQDFTGQQATLDGDGRSFQAISAARRRNGKAKAA